MTRHVEVARISLHLIWSVAGLRSKAFMVFCPAQSLLTQGIAAQQTQNRWMEKKTNRQTANMGNTGSPNYPRQKNANHHSKMLIWRIFWLLSGWHMYVCVYIESLWRDGPSLLFRQRTIQNFGLPLHSACVVTRWYPSWRNTQWTTL